MALRPASADDLRDALARGIVHGRRIRFGYAKASAQAPEVRHIEPWRLIHAEGENYLVGHDVDRGEARLFRVDRILGVQVLDDPSTEAVQRDAEDRLEDGSVQLRPEGAEERWATVRYSPEVARWVRERYPDGDDEGGAYTVRHRLLSEDWMVRHVLSYGTDAEVLEPERLRERVVQAAAGG